MKKTILITILLILTPYLVSAEWVQSSTSSSTSGSVTVVNNLYYCNGTQCLSYMFNQPLYNNSDQVYFNTTYYNYLNSTSADLLYYSITNPLNFLNFTTASVFNDSLKIDSVNSSVQNLLSYNTTLVARLDGLNLSKLDNVTGNDSYILSSYLNKVVNLSLNESKLNNTINGIVSQQFLTFNVTTQFNMTGAFINNGINNITVFNDGYNTTISETTLNGFDWFVNSTSPTKNISAVKIRWLYSGGSSHIVYFKIKDCSGVWHVFGTTSTASSYMTQTFDVSDIDNVCDGVLQLEFNHTPTGNPSHIFSIDAIQLIYTNGIVGGGVSGTGTTNTVAMFTDTSSIGNSPMSVSGSLVSFSDGASFTGNVSITGNVTLTNLTITSNGTKTTLKIPSGSNLEITDDSMPFAWFNQNDNFVLGGSERTTTDILNVQGNVTFNSSKFIAPILFGSCMRNGTYCDGGQSRVARTSATATTANVLRCYPFFTGRGYSIDRIGFSVITSNTNISGKAAIYSDNGQAYPDRLIANSSDIVFSGTAAAMVNTTSATLSPNSLYWACNVFNATGVGTGLAVIPISDIAPVLGSLGTAVTGNTFYTVAMTYTNPFPDPFTAGATTILTLYPNIIWRVRTDI